MRKRGDKYYLIYCDTDRGAATCLSYAVGKTPLGPFEKRGVIIDMSEMESSLRRHLLKKPITSVFLCDHSKFGKRSVFHTAPLDMVDYVITDAPLSPASPRPRREVLVV